MSLFLIAAVLAALGLLGHWGLEGCGHRQRVEGVGLRIHVNGIRGKSTVTRILAGALREAGYTTIAKSTGTEAAVIDRHGVDRPIDRKGPATILEQIDVVRTHVADDIDALVIECMALKPTYQAASEAMMIRSTIGVLTNVREDHQDVMGESLSDIARSLMSTCPTDGILITAEQNPAILRLIHREASRRNTRVIVADPESVTDAEISRFDYVAFKENISIGLVLADLLAIDRGVAMRGMVEAPPDPGVLRMKDLRVGDKMVTWANLFAVNDRESMIAAMEKLAPYITSDTTVVGILNNRSDRERRAIQFADIAVHDLEFDRLATFGAFETVVTQRLVENGFPRGAIDNLGDTRQPTIAEVLDHLVHRIPTAHVLLVGFVNIHTPQAELLLQFFEHEAEEWEEGAGVMTLPERSRDDAPVVLTA